MIQNRVSFDIAHRIKTIFLTFDNTLEDVIIESQKHELLVKLKTTNPTDVTYFFLSNPDRLVLDINDTMLSEMALQKFRKMIL